MNDECIHVASIPRHADKPVPQKEADANLIAAAPDLYRTLEMLANYHEPRPLTAAAVMTVNWNDVRAIALRVLAKARGEQS